MGMRFINCGKEVGGVMLLGLFFAHSFRSFILCWAFEQCHNRCSISSWAVAHIVQGVISSLIKSILSLVQTVFSSILLMFSCTAIPQFLNFKSLATETTKKLFSPQDKTARTKTHLQKHRIMNI